MAEFPFKEELMSAITTLLVSLAAVAVGFIVAWTRAIVGVRHDPAARNTPAGDAGHPGVVHIAIGAITRVASVSTISGSSASRPASGFSRRLAPREGPVGRSVCIEKSTGGVAFAVTASEQRD